MSTIRIQIKKTADLDGAIPGLAKLWTQIKAGTGTRCRAPKSLTITDDARPEYLNDGEMGRRYALDLRTMALSESLSMSSGEWAAHGGSNHDEEMRGIQDGAALVSCVWHDYYRYFSITIQVAKGAIPAQLAA